jgi:hypothetical protein
MPNGGSKLKGEIGKTAVVRGFGEKTCSWDVKKSRERARGDQRNNQPLRSVQDKGKRMKDKGLIALGEYSCS